MSNLEDTNKMSKVTDEMLETFSDKKPEKTVVEFDEDKVEEQVTEEQKEDKPKKKSFFLKGLGITLLIVFAGIVIFGI